MRFVEIEPGLRLRFPGQSEEFSEGVEIGMLVAMMSWGVREFTRTIASTNLEQARAVAEKLGYRLVTGRENDQATDVNLRLGGQRPALRLISSRPRGQEGYKVRVT